MEPNIERLWTRISGVATRRGFLTRLGKVAFGIAAAVVGAGFATSVAKAQPYCCTGAGEKQCDGSGCPPGSSVYYKWTCCDLSIGRYIICNDCCTSSNNCPGSNYVCTYGTVLHFTC